MAEYLIFALVGYLLGSLPFGLITGRVLGQVDVREHGSGMTGMTNVLRTVGLRAAALVLLMDMAKGALAVLLVRLFSASAGVEVVAGLAAVVGHIWPVFLRFKGGRGTSAGWGALFVFSPIAGVVGGAIGVPAIIISRYGSLGSLLGTSSGAATLIALAMMSVVDQTYAVYGALTTAIIVGRHWDNIGRLAKGEERKLGGPAT